VGCGKPATHATPIRPGVAERLYAVGLCGVGFGPGRGIVMFLKQRAAILEWAEDHDNLFDDRLLIVSGLYLLSFLEFDVGIVKSVTVAFAAYVMMVLPLGRRLLEHLCILLFAAAMLRWTNIAGINELAEVARQGLVHIAQR
jgi:hypothetical protein